MKNLGKTTRENDIPTISVVEDSSQTRLGSTAYLVGYRAMYPEKYGFAIICTTAGTTSATLPDWPAVIESGVTTIADGTVVWTVYDMTQGGGSGFDYTAIPIRENSKAYIANARVLFKGKYGYACICETAGTSGASEPTWPTAIESGVTTISDGSVVWKVYDLCVGGNGEPVFRYSTMPTASSANVGKIVQYIGVTTTVAPIYTNGFFYKCIEDATVTPSTYSWGAVSVQPEGAPSVDNTSIGFNGSSQLEVKDSGVGLAKLATQDVAEAGKVYSIKSDGKTELNHASDVLGVDDVTVEKDTTAHVIQVKDSGISTAKLADGAVSLAKLATQAATDEKKVYAIKADGTTELAKAEDIIKVDDATVENDATNGIQVKDLGITTAKIADDAVNLDKIDDAAISTEIADASSAVDTKLPTEKAVRTELDKILENIPVRENSKAYAIGERALYSGKYGYALVCLTAGTSATSAPTWPTTITSGLTTLTDGTVVWTIYDMTEVGSSGGGSDVIKKVVGEIAIGSTECTLTIPENGKFVDAQVYDGNEVVLTAVEIVEATATATGSVKFSIASAYTNALSCVVTYATIGVKSISTEIAVGSTSCVIPVPAGRKIASMFAMEGSFKVLVGTEVVQPTESSLGSVTFTLESAQASAVTCYVVYSN